MHAVLLLCTTCAVLTQLQVPCWRSALTFTLSKCCGACCSTADSFTTLGLARLGRLRPTALRPDAADCLSTTASPADALIGWRFCLASKWSFSLRLAT